MDTIFVRNARWNIIGKRQSASFAEKIQMAALIALPKSLIVLRRCERTNRPSQTIRSPIRKQGMIRSDCFDI